MLRCGVGGALLRLINAALPQKSDLARVRCIVFVFDSCDFVDRPRFPSERGMIHELTRKTT